MDVGTRIRDVLLDILFPRVRCMVCEGTTDVKHGICTVCRDKMERYPIRDVCTVCGKAGAECEICLMCHGQRPLYTAARAVFVYDGAVRTLIHRMKFHGEYDLTVRLFAKEMEQALKELSWPIDCVTAVPTEAKTLRRRGYNQAEKLAKRLCRLQKLCYEGHLLKKKRGTHSQVGLNAQERRMNLQGALLPGRRSRKASGKRVLLIDDVYTTGSTAEACAQVLLACGAKEVYVLCAARVPDRALEQYLAGKME